MIQLLNGIQKTHNFSIPFTVPQNIQLVDETIAALKVAMSHPVPLSAEFEKGFTGSLASLEPLQIVSLLFTDISAFRMSLYTLGDADDDEKKEFVKLTAWRGYLQSLYAAWLSFSCGINLKLSETTDGFTRLEVTTDAKDESFEPAFKRISNDGDYFTHILTKCGEVVDPVGVIGATINNALQSLAVMEQSCFFAFTHCTDTDSAETKEYYLSMAKAAFVIRSMAMDWMLKGVKGFTKTKPLNSKMKLNLNSINKESLKEIRTKVLASLWNLSLGLTMFQYVTEAQILFAPNLNIHVIHV